MKYKKKRLWVVTVVVFGFVILMNSTFTPVLFYNSSASLPKGLYYKVDYDGHLEKGDIVVFSPPPEVAQLAYDRGYLPDGIPMMKKVAATAGDEVFLESDKFYAAGICYGPVFDVDTMGRKLEAYPFSHYIVQNDEFIAVGTHEKSWDSRFYGPVPVDRIIARVHPLILTD